MSGPRGRPRHSRAGTLLVLAGIVGVLSVTFLAGVWTGHNWPVLAGNPRSPATAEATPTPPVKARSSGPAGERPRAPDTLPTLTFYHDLTAPLTAPPPVARPGKTRPPEPKREPAGKTAAASPPPPAPGAARAELSAASDPGGRFTIQVAAYNARPPAEALRATLAAAGHEARVLEADSGSVRYRVQVGTFPSREAAREAAARLAAERSLSAFVTTR